MARRLIGTLGDGSVERVDRQGETVGAEPLEVLSRQAPEVRLRGEEVDERAVRPRREGAIAGRLRRRAEREEREHVPRPLVAPLLCGGPRLLRVAGAEQAGHLAEAPLVLGPLGHGLVGRARRLPGWALHLGAAPHVVIRAPEDDELDAAIPGEAVLPL